MIAHGFEDMKDDLPFASGAPSKVELTKESVIAMYTEPCPKCRGTGAFYGYSGRIVGKCYECEGKGKKSFKTSPEQRAKGRMAAERAKERKLEEKAAAVQSWKESHEAEWAWIVESAPRFEFAGAMLESVNKFGSLTENQLAAVRRCIDGQKARAEARKAAEAAAPTVNVDHLERSFQKAAESGLKWPRIIIGSMVLKPAGANSKNPGAIYVTNDGQYLGKVHGGRFIKTRECTEEQEANVLEFVQDPKAAAEAYGKRTGQCCICGRELTNEGSIDAGIGPICAKRFGW